jgi:hypothetical protein
LIGYGQARGFVSKSGSPEAQADNLLSMWEGLQVVRSRLSLSERTAAEACFIFPVKERSAPDRAYRSHKCNDGLRAGIYAGRQ